MLLELHQGDGWLPWLPFWCRPRLGKLSSGGISVKLRAQATAKLADTGSRGADPNPKARDPQFALGLGV